MKQMARKRYSRLANPVRISLLASDHRAQITETAIAELMAISSLENDIATDADMRQLHFMLMMAQELARDGIGPEALSLCARATASNMKDANLLRQLASIHDQQRDAATAAQYLRAMYRI